MQDNFNINKDTRTKSSYVVLMPLLLNLNIVNTTFSKSMFHHFSALCMKVLIGGIVAKLLTLNEFK